MLNTITRSRSLVSGVFSYPFKPFGICSMKSKPGNKLESVIQDEITEFLETRGWHVMSTHGNIHQEGFPDLYCTHPDHGQRWVEVKRPTGYKFTRAQREHFPFISAAVGIWILTSASDHEYTKLFRPQNWYKYL